MHRDDGTRIFSIRVVRIACIVMAMNLSLTNPARAESGAPVSAREPLRYRNMGVYGWWEPYFWEGPFDFAIVQAFVLPHESLTEVQNVSDAEHAKAWNANLMKARAAGKRILAIVTPGQGEPPSEKYDRAFAAFLDHVNVDELYAVSISEEHALEEGRHEALVNSYHRLKERHPDLPVYQWYTNTSRGDAIPGFKWPLLPADGWIINELFADSRDFEFEVRRYRMLGTPVVHIVWASPVLDDSYPFQPSVFDGQLRVAREYDLPCAYFCLDRYENRKWGWDDAATEPTREVFRRVLDARQKARTIKMAAPPGDPGEPLQRTVLEKSADGTFRYRESFDLRTKVTGENLPGHDFMERSLIKGFHHVQWRPDPSRIVVRSDEAGPLDVSLTSHWITPAGERCRFTASARLAQEPPAGVEVVFEVSLNGYDWLAKATDTDHGVLRIDLPAAGDHLYTRLRIAADKMGAAASLAAIDWIEVQGRPPQ